MQQSQLHKSDVNRSGVLLISIAHLVTDLYPGVVPALLPFLASIRGYSYSQLAGLTLAVTVISSLAQPVFGIIGDRKGVRWLVPTGIFTASLGVTSAVFTSSYLLTCAAVAVSGLGVAAFHPEGSRIAREHAGNSNKAMSTFALGGNIGYAAGALLAALIFSNLGLNGTPLLLLPAAATIWILARHSSFKRHKVSSETTDAKTQRSQDNWRQFTLLIVVIILRSIMFSALTSLLGVFFIRTLNTSATFGSSMLSVFLFSGVAGTFIGGVVADKYNRVLTTRLGFVLSVPSLGLLLTTARVSLAVVAVVGLGIALFLPFSVMIMLGQDYLPNHIGTASGVTVGLPMSVGGLFAPFIGRFADATSLPLALTMLFVSATVALLVLAFLREPPHRSR